MKKYPCVIQDGVKDCGICSLLSIIRYYGGNISKEYLSEVTNTNKSGVSALALLKCGEDLGFNVQGIEGDFEKLEKQHLPCIAHVIIDNKFKHFIVIYEIDKKHKRLLIADPAKGIKKIRFNDFSSITTNKYLLFIPRKPIPNYSVRQKVQEVFKDFFKKNIKHIIVVQIFSIFISIMTIVTTFQMQLMMEEALIPSAQENLSIIMKVILSLSLLKLILDFFRKQIINYLSHKLDMLLTKELFNHILSLPLIYYKNKSCGEIINRMTDISELRNHSINLVVSIMIDSMLLIFVCFSLFLINIKLTLIAIIIFGLLLLVNKLFSKILQRKLNILKEKESAVNSYLVESVKSIETIKGLNIKDRIIAKFYNKYDSLLNETYQFNSIYSKEVFLKDVINKFGHGIILLLGGLAVINNKLTIGELITFEALFIYFLEPIKNLISFDAAWKESKTIIQRINELYALQPEVLKIDEKYEENSTLGEIELRKVTYSYNFHENIFSNISFKINTGEKVLIIGKSGSGKSTIARVLMKYLKVERDKVYINKIDINDYNLLKIRNKIAYSSQNEYLFYDTIYNNICLGKISDYHRFLKIASMFGINEIIKKDILGYQMLLEDNGENLSGGERQRVILARTFMLERDIYILDESLSQLDIRSERKILKSIFKEYSNKTIVIISHRYDNNDLFDKIISLDKVGIYV